MKPAPLSHRLRVCECVRVCALRRRHGRRELSSARRGERLNPLGAVLSGSGRGAPPPRFLPASPGLGHASAAERGRAAAVVAAAGRAGRAELLRGRIATGAEQRAPPVAAHGEG